MPGPTTKILILQNSGPTARVVITKTRPHLFHDEHAHVLTPRPRARVHEENVSGVYSVRRAVRYPHLGTVDLVGRPIARSHRFRRHAQHVRACVERDETGRGEVPPKRRKKCKGNFLPLLIFFPPAQCLNATAVIS